MDKNHITRAQARAVLLSIAPYAPSSIIDAISGYVVLLIEYAPPTTQDELLQMCFAISLKFLDECHDGASPRAVFDSILLSMSQDLLQPFPEFKDVKDVSIRRELIKELRFRWSLYENLSKHLDAVKPSLTVAQLEDYFITEDTQTAIESVEDDTTSEEDLVLDFVDDQLQFVKATIVEPTIEQTPIPTITVGLTTTFTHSATPSTPPYLHMESYADIVMDNDPHSSPEGSTNFVAPTNISSLKNRPYSYYRTFYAAWLNSLSPGYKKELLLFVGRRPNWKKLSGYDISLPWRYKCDT